MREYVDLLPSVYARSEPSLLSDVATDEEQNRMLMYLLYMKQRKESLDTRLLGLDIVDVGVLEDGQRLLVTTEERWEYRNMDAETGEAKTDYIEREYRSEYTLIREGERWQVTEVDVQDSAGTKTK